MPKCEIGSGGKMGSSCRSPGVKWQVVVKGGG